MLKKVLYTHGDYSDLTISCGGREFHVHKALVCPQSAFFTAACQAFREQVIDLPDYDPIAVEIVLYYLYHQEYHIPRQATSGEQSNQEGIGETPIPEPSINTVAGKCSIQRLQTVALRKFKETAMQCWDSDDFLKMVTKVYTSTAETDRRLKDVVIPILHEHPVLLSKKTTQNMLRQINMLAYDLVMYGYSLQSTKRGNA
ncbi:hypothetical protein GGR51DRAFT_568764 [Nemania sp. FL0031]|nr:hypothetical protein GGR51DRAFT_568764 [Nemania sp. FL0031]